MDGSRWRPATRSEPCLICGHDDWCQTTGKGEGQVCHCMREPNGAAKECKDGAGWIHYPHGRPPRTPRLSQPSKRRKSDVELDAQWRPVAKRMHEYALREGKLSVLAETLGVSTESLTRLGVGYGELAGRTCWTFAERNAYGLVVGINRRLLDGSKRTAPGGRRGLSMQPCLVDIAGPLHVVEGGSDMAAAGTLGMSAVGRPSNIGGLRDLIPYVRRLTERRIVVLGERDRKPHATMAPEVQARHNHACRCCLQCYPGKAGAMRIQQALRQLGRRIEWRLPPDGAKDLRAWLNQSGADPNNKAAMAVLRKRFCGC